MTGRALRRVNLATDRDRHVHYPFFPLRCVYVHRAAAGGGLEMHAATREAAMLNAFPLGNGCLARIPPTDLPGRLGEALWADLADPSGEKRAWAGSQFKHPLSVTEEIGTAARAFAAATPSVIVRCGENKE